MNKKNTGTYYTPEIIADFMILHVFKHFAANDSFDILEPCCGDGQMIKSLFNYFHKHKRKSAAVTLVEINKQELEKTRKYCKENSNCAIKLKYENRNFLEYRNSNRFDLIVGNPPYIRKRRLSPKQIKHCEKIHQEAGVKSLSVHNIWTAFLLSSIKMLNDDGILFFVLPAELLQVNYTKKIREYLKESFIIIEIFSFKELVFSDIEQNVVLFLGSKKIRNNVEPGIYFYQIDEISQLDKINLLPLNNNVHKNGFNKWTSYILTENELKFLSKLKKQTNPIIYYCDKIEVGIVTAANNYFTVNKETIDKYKLKGISRPVISHSCYINNKIEITAKDIAEFTKENRCVCLLQFPDKPIKQLTDYERNYIEFGESKQLHKRYKCEQRKNWYHIPTTWVSDGFFAKRIHILPHIIVNTANTLVTDAFYRINIKNEYQMQNLVFSFYNTLTLIFAELEGRYYGGGVLELTPNEFKKLPIPYINDLKNKDYQNLVKLFKDNANIIAILDYTDIILLHQFLKLNYEEIKNLRFIYKKLLERRLKLNKKYSYKTNIDNIYNLN